MLPIESLSDHDMINYITITKFTDINFQLLHWSHIWINIVVNPVNFSVDENQLEVYLQHSPSENFFVFSTLPLASSSNSFLVLKQRKRSWSRNTESLLIKLTAGTESLAIHHFPVNILKISGEIALHHRLIFAFPGTPKIILLELPHLSNRSSEVSVLNETQIFILWPTFEMEVILKETPLNADLNSDMDSMLSNNREILLLSILQRISLSFQKFFMESSIKVLQ